MKLRSIAEMFKPKAVKDFQKSNFIYATTLDDDNVSRINPHGGIGVASTNGRNLQWYEVLDHAMAEHGFMRVGSGKYAGVYKHQSYKYVIKAFRRDDGYLTWLKYCLDHQDNPYVPKTRGRLVKITDHIFAVRLEVLEKPRGRYFDDMFNDFMTNFYMGRDFEDGYQEDIADFFRDHEPMLDLHGGNYMFRGEQMVFVDPFSNHSPKGQAMDLGEIDLRGLM